MYFEHYDVTPEHGLREAVNTILESNVCTGDGIEYESNFRALRDNPAVEVVGGWNFSEHVKLRAHVKGVDFAEIIEACKTLCDYPILDEYLYSEVRDEKIEEELRSELDGYDVDFDEAVTIFFDEYYEYVDGSNYPYFSWDAETFAAFVSQVRAKSQSWDCHYVTRLHHSAPECQWCNDTTLPSSELSA